METCLSISEIFTSFREYLTYKEWKLSQTHIGEKFKIGEYLTYKEWKQDIIRDFDP